jgi:exodeoxyribonuclease VII small subunit
MPSYPPVDTLAFEAALVELDAVTQKLEAGNVSLEESLQLLERGQSLAAHCDTLLSQAESTLEQLVITGDGELETRALEWAEDDEDDA